MSELPERRPRRLGPSQWLRIGISAALIAWIVRKVDWHEFGQTIAGTDPIYLLASLAVSPVLVLISAWKWQILLRARAQDPGLGKCFRLYLIGYFFNNFLPTNVGGDVMRGYLLGRETGRTAEAMASVFLERFTGISALVGLALLAIPFGPDELYDTRVSLSIAAVVTAYVVILWAVMDKRVLSFTRRRPNWPLMGKIVRVQEAIDVYRDDRGVLVRCLALSVLFYLVAAINIQVTARAFNAYLSLSQAFLLMPVILLISLLPLSFGGIGLSEWAYVFALGKYEISPAVSLSTALLMRLKNVLLGLLGGVGHAVPFATASTAAGLDSGEARTEGRPR